MQNCCLLRALTGSRSATRKTARYRSAPARVNDDVRRWPVLLSAVLLEWIGCRALQNTLNAIPDSNDDFNAF